jgi:hypothetical protein
MEAKKHSEQEVNNCPTMPLRLLTNRFKSDSFQPLLRNTSRPVSRVLSPWGVTHDGWPFIWSLCCHRLRATNPGGEAETLLKPEGFVPPLFGFAPGGVCHAKLVAKFAVRSYRTVSPSPRTCPDFPPLHPFEPSKSGHPADW